MSKHLATVQGKKITLNRQKPQTEAGSVVSWRERAATAIKNNESYDCYISVTSHNDS